MRCEQFEIIVRDLARDQIMEAGMRVDALAHGAGCDDCGARLEDERNLTVGLRALAGQMNSLEAAPEVEARLLAAFRDRGNLVSLRPSIALRRNRWRYWIAAAAAVLLIVFSVLALRSRLGRSVVQPPAPEIATRPTTAARDNQMLPSEKQNAIAKEPDLLTPRRALHRKRASSPSTAIEHPANTAHDATANSEVVTDFFPVNEANSLNLQDGGQLVRVELPRTALMRFGLPVNMDHAGERVKADVLVGNDGLARAIRFVR